MIDSSRWRASHGFGLIEIIVVVVVVAIVGAGAYLYMQQEGGSANLNSEQAQTKTACQKLIDDELLCTSLATWGNTDKSEMVYEMTSTDEDGVKSSMTMKIKGEDSHTISNSDGEAHEMMSVDGVSYMKMDGVWYKFPASQTDDDQGMIEETTSQIDQVARFDEEEVDRFEYKRLGEESCSLGTCVKYELIDSDDADQAAMYLWVEKKSAKMARMLVKQTDGSEWDTVMKYESVTITAPSDAKDFSSMMDM